VRRNKFGAKKTTVNGVRFDSKWESVRWQQLELLQKAVQIPVQGVFNAGAEAVKQITHGVQEIIVATSTLAASAMGIWAAFKASPLSKMLSVANRPDVQAIVTTDKALAEAVPSEKVIAPEQAP